MLAGFLAGAGALFAFFGRYASSYMFYHVSGEAVVWAIVGGAGTLLGPLVGTSLFIIVREIVSTHWEHHALIVGAVAILVVIFAPKGIVGLWNGWIRALTERVRRGAVETGPSHERAGPAHRKIDQALRGLTAVDNLSFSLAGGRLHAIIGPNGPARRRSSIWFGLLRRPRPCSSRRARSPASSRTRSAGSASSGRCRSRACSRSSPWRRTCGSPDMRDEASCIRSRCDGRSRHRREGRAHARADRASRWPSGRPARCHTATSRCSKSAWR